MDRKNGNEHRIGLGRQKAVAGRCGRVRRCSRRNAVVKNWIDVTASRPGLIFLCGVTMLPSAALAQVTSNGTNTIDVQDAGTGNIWSADNANAGNERNRVAIIQTAASAYSSVTVSQLGADNQASVTNKGVQNKATAIQGNGRLSSMFNQVTIVQEGGAFDSTIWIAQFEGSQAAPNVATLMQDASGSLIDISARGFANSSDVQQHGRSHKANISMSAGGVSSSGAPQGNSIALKQNGSTHTASFSVGNTAAIWGKSNSAEVAQAGSNHLVRIWQRGNSDGVAVEQSDSANPNSKADPYRAIADISQFASGSTVAVKQVGFSNAMVSQGAGSGSAVTINQTEPSSGAIDRGSAISVSQSGIANRLEAAQSGSNLTASVWQKLGSSANTAAVQQGTGSTATADFSSTFFGNIATDVAARARDLTAKVTQSGGRNNAQIRQDGIALTAMIEQLGTAESNFSNFVRVAQQGSGNSATARQSANVGASPSAAPGSGQAGDEFYFVGGARSAEITILQSNSGNAATAEQRGRGQVARIEQSGQNNVASIVQSELATNATAVIRQTGNGNSYSVGQDQAGQYISVSQTGTGNAITNLIQRGPGS